MAPALSLDPPLRTPFGLRVHQGCDRMDEGRGLGAAFRVVAVRGAGQKCERICALAMKCQGIHPQSFVIDGLASYRAAFSELGCADRHQHGRRRDNNRAESSHLPIRRREKAVTKLGISASMTDKLTNLWRCI